MRNKKTAVVIVIILAAAAVLSMIALGRRGSKAETVKTTVAAKGDIQSYLSTNAVIASKNVRNYIGASQLVVKSVKVKVGDSVKTGQQLLEYDLNDISISLEQAKLQYSNAVLQKNELMSQKEQVDAAIEKLDAQIAQLEASNNPSDIVQLQTLKQQRQSLQPISNDKVQLMENSVSIAKLTLDSAASKYDKYKDGIVADSDGVVTALNAVEGSVLNPSQPAVVVQQLDNLKAVLSLGKFDAQKIKTGQEAIIKNGSSTYKGTVSYVSPAASKAVPINGEAASLKAEIDITDRNTDLKVDFDVNVDILLGSAANTVKVPVECIKYDKGEKSYVYRLVDNKAVQTEIKPGLQSDTEVQVLEGLSAGDTVIVNPGISIKDGVTVKVANDDKK